MKKYFLIALILSSSIIAQNSTPEYFGVFPYRIDQQMQPSTEHTTTKLSRLFQTATLFLLKILFEYTFLDHTDIQEKFSDIKELSEQTARIQINKICGKNYFSYFLTGEVYYFTENYIQIKNSVFSCITNQKLYETESRGATFQIQGMIRNNLKKIIPFLPENQIYKKWNSKFEPNKEIFILIDQSGSMESLFPLLKKTLQTDVIHIYGIQPEKGIQKYKTIDEIHGSGILNIKDLIQSLEEIKKELIPYQSELWIFFDSFQTMESREINELNIALKSFSYLGIPVYIYQTYNMDIEEWTRIENLKQKGMIFTIPVKYGRSCGFSNGENFFFIRKGREYFLCPDENKYEFIKGTSELSECIKMSLFMYTNKETNLEVICKSYSLKNKTKNIYTSNVISDLDFVIQKIVHRQDYNKTYYKFLIKDSKSAFWISVSDRKIVNELLEYKNKKEEFYIGLSFYKDFESIKAIPDKIVFPKPDNIPELFLTSYNQIKNIRPNSEDLWFFFVKILDMRYE